MDLDGTLLGSTHTNSDGGFALPLTSPPRDYRVVVSGGMNQGKAFQGTLQGDARNRPVIGEAVQVNPVTTLVSLNVQGTSGLDLQSSAMQVKTFLALPANTMFGVDMSLKRFNTVQFASEAAEAGGNDQFLKTLLTEMKSGRTHPFQKPLLQSGGGDPFAGDLAGYVAKGLADGAIGAAGSAAFGGFMSLIGLSNDSGKSGEEAALAKARADAEMKKLDEISVSISNLADKVDTIQERLAGLPGLISLSTYNVMATTGPSNQYIAYNAVIRQKMSDLAAYPVTETEGRAQRLQELNDYIKSHLIDDDIMVLWDLALRGSNNANGLLVTWQKVVAQGSLDRWSSKEAQSVQTQWDYYDAQQLESMIYVVNYMKANPNIYPQNIIFKKLSDWQERRKSQMSLIRGNSKTKQSLYLPTANGIISSQWIFTNSLPSGSLDGIGSQSTTVDRKTNKMWTTTPYYVNSDYFKYRHVKFVPDSLNPWLDMYADYAHLVFAMLGREDITGWHLPPMPKRDITGLYPNPTIVSIPKDTFENLKNLGISIRDWDNLVTDEARGDYSNNLGDQCVKNNGNVWYCNDKVAENYIATLKYLRVYTNTPYSADSPFNYCNIFDNRPSSGNHENILVYSNTTINPTQILNYGLSQNTTFYANSTTDENATISWTLGRTGCYVTVNDYKAYTYLDPLGGTAAGDWTMALVFQRDNTQQLWYDN